MWYNRLYDVHDEMSNGNNEMQHPLLSYVGFSCAQRYLSHMMLAYVGIHYVPLRFWKRGLGERPKSPK